LSALYSWAIGEGRADTNPVVGTNQPGIETTRDRVLSDNEIVQVWANTGDDPAGAIMRLLILTGQRRGEVSGMRSKELDLEKAIWTIPGERTKNHLTHVVPLSTPAISILSEHVSNSETYGVRAGA
jgi:integrase